MKRKSIVILLFLCMSSLSAADPITGYTPVERSSMVDQMFPDPNKLRETLAVINYDIGASFLESYRNTERLIKKTEVRTWTAGPGACGGGGLEANVRADVVGQARIAWMSWGKGTPATKGRAIEYGRSVEDLTGAFSIDKFIQLNGNRSYGNLSIDWLGEP
ncbi:MAG TPA: hypothetical protein PLI05_11630 [Methanotrichaceae archaeon]|nr:MAG: hypothetical protein A4E47_00390 [Methanosaeta sp. PtaU1.Bin028]HOT07909.1 hypothetical protein [Methanotrichaceae archaeon]HQF17699.1 hypothetical protein [Methanotrichaceae archaeon]HQI92265.1 hypothetical protein [Methanotrichaceae archaeon]HQJ29405.1 hypothetical protein [Methanotrichaceae archaeon]